MREYEISCHLDSYKNDVIICRVKDRTSTYELQCPAGFSTGFNIGYAGQGPHALAKAIAYDFFMKEELILISDEVFGIWALLSEQIFEKFDFIENKTKEKIVKDGVPLIIPEEILLDLYRKRPSKEVLRDIKCKVISTIHSCAMQALLAGLHPEYKTLMPEHTTSVQNINDAIRGGLLQAVSYMQDNTQRVFFNNMVDHIKAFLALDKATRLYFTEGADA